MGCNLDLCSLLGVPERMECPRCRQSTLTYFDDYDIECGNPNPEPGRWKLHMCCKHCEHTWDYSFIIRQESVP